MLKKICFSNFFYFVSVSLYFTICISSRFVKNNVSEKLNYTWNFKTAFVNLEIDHGYLKFFTSTYMSVYVKLYIAKTLFNDIHKSCIYMHTLLIQYQQKLDRWLLEIPSCKQKDVNLMTNPGLGFVFHQLPLRHWENLQSWRR